MESAGYRCDGRLMALNSYENRVYQVGTDDAGYLVAKFYRPGRWSRAAILEEHAFAHELEELDIPVIPPVVRDGESLLQVAGFEVAVYHKVSGRAPEFESSDHLEWLGRLLARIHALGEQESFQQRGELNAESFGDRSLAVLRESGRVPPDVAEAYSTAASDAVELAKQIMQQHGGYRRIRLHGDFHPGNILWGEQGPLIVDLDDARMGPGIQDLWMLLSGSRDEASGQLASVLEGYRQFRAFDRGELILIEPLRTLRLVHYAAWLARRWDDPAFPAAFPFFSSHRWWEEQINTLREQMERMHQPALDPDRLESDA